MIPTLFLASILIFFMIRLIPGDIIDLMISTQFAQVDVKAVRAALEHQLGWDVPIFIQYGRWMGNIILHGDLGLSLWEQNPVTDHLMARFPVTLELGILALVIAQVIGLPIGIYSALRQDTWGDYIARSFGILAIAVPSFWLGTMIIVFPSLWWGYMSPLLLISFTEDPIGHLQQFIPPAMVLGMAMSGQTMRMTRTMMLETLRQDYIRTAWAKGLKERVVVVRHALKNALIPVITIVGIRVKVMLGGTVIVEQIFGLPGMGRLLLTSVLSRDYTIVSGVVLFSAVGIVLVNLMVDLTYGFLDPRVHYK